MRCSAIRDRGYATHAVVAGAMTHIIIIRCRFDSLGHIKPSPQVGCSDGGLLHVMLRRSLPSHGYRQQRAIIDVVCGVSLGEEKISVKTRDRSAISSGENSGPSSCNCTSDVSGETDH